MVCRLKKFYNLLKKTTEKIEAVESVMVSFGKVRKQMDIKEK